MHGSRYFCQGGPGPTTRKQPGQRFFFKSAAYFTVYRGGPMVLLQRKLNFHYDLEVVQQFPGVCGGGGGSNC